MPGRQRWDVGMVLGRPRVAGLLETELRASPGIRFVRADPVTGRLLLYHDKERSSEEVDRLVREAVARVVPQVAVTVVRPSGSAGPAAGVAHGQPQARRQAALPLVVVGGVGAVALGKRSLRPSPMVRFGAVLAATVIVVRRALRRSARSQPTSQAPAGSRRLRQRPLLRIVGRHRRQLYLATFLSVVEQVLETALYILFGWILVVITTGPGAILMRLGLVTASSQLWFLAVTTALVAIGAAALSFVGGVVWRGLAQAVQHEWRTRIYDRIQRVELRYLEGERTSRLASVLTEDIGQMGRFFATAANDLLQIVTSFLILIPVFLIFAPSIAWIAFLPVPFIAWLSFYYQEHAVPGYAASGESGSLLNSQLINNLEASATVKSFTAEEYEIDRITRLSEVYGESTRWIDRRTTAYVKSVRAAGMVSLLGILVFGGLEVLGGTLSFEVFNALLGMPNLVLWKLPALGESVDQYQRTLAALRRVLGLERLPVEAAESGERLDVANVEGEMVLDRVTFAYPDRAPVLNDLSLRIAPGRTTGIVGVTGAGKTTIAKLLLRLEAAGAGRVLLDGQDVADLRLQDLRKAIGFVAQDAFLFDGTVGDNIRYGSFDADLDRVVGAAQLAEADGFVQAMPSGYDTMIGERGAALSGGQKQRISLARAFLKSAPILILDEATSAVDYETEEAIQRAIADYAKGRTLVIIAHRLSTIRHADWIYVMGQGGVIVEGGTHQELVEREGVYASLWRLQIGEART